MKIRSEKCALDKIYKRRNRYEIPDWQRDEVWGVAKKQKLIDSVLRGWKLPKFYFLKSSSNSTEYEVVDGQQRLISIWEFFGNELALSSESAKHFKAKTYGELSDKLSDSFDDFEIEYDEIEDASEVEIKEFFQRLQEGLPLTSSERLNSVHSALRDFCRKLVKHKFFVQTTVFADKRYAHFDVASKFIAIEIGGLQTGLRFRDLKSTFEANNSFSTKSEIAKRTYRALDFLREVLPQKFDGFRNRAITQSFVTLTCRLVEDPSKKPDAKRFAKFAKQFLDHLSAEVEKGRSATDFDLIQFQKTINANVRTGPRTRHKILLRKLLKYDPSFFNYVSSDASINNSTRGGIDESCSNIRKLIDKINDNHSSHSGEDYFKATSKTVKAQEIIGELLSDFRGYKEFVESCYFLFWEGAKSRLPDLKPVSFTDINDLRTAEQHDVDHGKTKEIRKKRLKLAKTFQKYSGTGTPSSLDPSLFKLVQLNLLNAVEQDLQSILLSQTQKSGAN
jgi:Protein of unknown function DUF262